MSFLEILDTLLLKPLQLIFEVIFAVSDVLIDNPGVSIIVLSLVMNLLVLPLYMRADAMQEEERQMEKRLHKGVAHIKKTFKGDEQMMMLRTYYRQNNYKPAYVLRGATSLLLEIPFFIAAYRFLSGLQLLNGIPFGPIADLGRPDGMLQISGMSINILPFIMTAVNLCSCMIYTKDSSLKTKLQLYGMAVFFLIFLYASPSGLVFYWTLNNLFSLIKTVFYKLKNPRKIIDLISSVVGIGVWIYGFFIFHLHTPKLMIFFAAFGMLMQVPAAVSFLKKHNFFKLKSGRKTASKANFLLGAAFLAVFTGVLIPSAVIRSSPQEFIASSTHFYHPVWFIASSFCMAFGIFAIWTGVFYWLSSASVRPVFDRVVWIFSGIAVIDYMVFNKNFGNLSANLQYEKELVYTLAEHLGNIMIVLVSAFVLYVIYEHFGRRISEVLTIGIIAVAIMSVPNIAYINSSVEAVKGQIDLNANTPNFALSRSGKNVIVLMLDRALGEQIPYIFEEKPELKNQFDGFTYYSNTISFGVSTNFGTPAIFGGYEYTPTEMNKRDGESLVSKHNEALKVMPVLFDQNGYQVTVINPVYANYQWIPDLSIYGDYPNINRYITGSKFSDDPDGKKFIEADKRNFFCYSILKSIPLLAQGIVYNNGNYLQTDYSRQNLIDTVTAKGINSTFVGSYSVLKNLANIGSIMDEDHNTFLLMVNDITHEPALLQEPDYEPSTIVDNAEYEDAHPKRIWNGHELILEDIEQMIHYHANMAAMIQLGKWFDFLRREDVYDNTRIILVSDHGHRTGSLDGLILDDGFCVSSVYPLLMVKDFNAADFTTSDTFMTNADVPTIAVDGIIRNPVNPFTGKNINSDEKTVHDQHIIVSDHWDIHSNNGNTFISDKWYSVHSNIWDKSNWKLVAEDAVLSTDDY